MGLAGLDTLSIELSSRCDKRTLCGFCGHQDKRTFPKLQFGDMDFRLVQSIRDQLEPGITISLHRDGDPLVYPPLAEALDLFRGFPISIVTHGETLGVRAKEVIDRATAVTVSVFAKDPDHELQLASLAEFLRVKGDRAPQVAVKFVGDVPDDILIRFRMPGVTRILHRRLHSAKGSHHYQRTAPPIPEGLVCLDFLHRPAIDWMGRVFLCRRLDPESRGYLGTIHDDPLAVIWERRKSLGWWQAHLEGRREDVPACAGCEFWGLANG